MQTVRSSTENSLMLQVTFVLKLSQAALALRVSWRKASLWKATSQ
ncbi:3-deoxy-7-phosphoheptulonate synthase, partial [Vibrio parahaemolyticus V-223/04]